MTNAFYVYMMTNRSRVVLYTGITNSLARRVWEHQNAEIKGFTEQYKVNRLGWRRSKKNALVETLNPKWSDLSAMIFEDRRGPSLRSG
jgi:putative endonuclease